MTTPFPYHLTDDTFTAYIDNVPYQTDRTNPSWPDIVAAVRDPEATDTARLITLIKPIHEVAAAVFGLHNVEVVGGSVLVNGIAIDTSLSRRVLDVSREGFPLDPWVRFVQNVYANPNESARDELYLFLEGHDMPLTPDGCFLAYKVVNDDYTDCRTSKIDNSVGAVVVMPGGRGAVDADRWRTCSTGLHFCSKGYLGSIGGYNSRVVIVKLNPADVVAIPADHANAKGRAWRYEVVGEISREQAGIRTWAAVDASWDAPEYEEEYDYDEPYGEESDDTAWDEGGFDPEPEPEEELAELGEIFIQHVAPTVVTVTVDPLDTVTVKTKEFGTLTFGQFKVMVSRYAGNFSALASEIGVPAGSVRKWAAKFRRKGCNI